MGSPACAGMDPPLALDWWYDPRLPRVRGDGPSASVVPARIAGAPPRARGWTPRPLARLAQRVGSPACAGMDPSVTRATTSGLRLPRVRGDGPAESITTGTVAKAPPRARGWTRPQRARYELLGGSPACAGMDPATDSAPPATMWLPRVRGDGPGLSVGVSDTGAAPPRARGWTLFTTRLPRAVDGSPACAGMDPCIRRGVGSGRRLPRVRGDGPDAPPLGPGDMTAPPRARGWTVELADVAADAAGSPACAGMDPRRLHPRLRLQGLPRVRGDGPQGRSARRRPGWAPPRARGWTRDELLKAVKAKGSPACAGMDPCGPGAWGFRPRLPRVRGDGPSSHGGLAQTKSAPPRARGWTPDEGRRHRADRGSPACAGMDPGSSGCSSRSARLPRVRGDGPRLRVRPDARPEAPPRARGWTVLELLDLIDAQGSPACAGMDPRARLPLTGMERLPRVRGDGPDSICLRCADARAPPRARGWTRADQERGVSDRGSPACAGMDRAIAASPIGTMRLPRVRGDGPWSSRR